MMALSTKQAINAAITQPHSFTAMDSPLSTLCRAPDGLYTPPFSLSSIGLANCVSFQREYAMRISAAANDAMKQTRKTLISHLYHKRAENA